MDDSALMCDGVIESYDEDADGEAKSNNKAKSYDETKTIPTNFHEKKQPVERKIFIFYLHFYWLLYHYW